MCSSMTGAVSGMSSVGWPLSCYTGHNSPGCQSKGINPCFSIIYYTLAVPSSSNRPWPVGLHAQSSRPLFLSRADVGKEGGSQGAQRPDGEGGAGGREAFISHHYTQSLLASTYKTTCIPSTLGLVYLVLKTTRKYLANFIM